MLVEENVLSVGGYTLVILVLWQRILKGTNPGDHLEEANAQLEDIHLFPLVKNPRLHLWRLTVILSTLPRNDPILPKRFSVWEFTQFNIEVLIQQKTFQRQSPMANPFEVARLNTF